MRPFFSLKKKKTNEAHLGRFTPPGRELFRAWSCAWSSFSLACCQPKIIFTMYKLRCRFGLCLFGHQFGQIFLALQIFY